jgi:electron transfer flavoprotein beta subunit
MNIAVLFKLVPDLVEELEIDASGTALDASWMRLIVNEFDDHAIEQAILLKEQHGGQVTVISPGTEGVDDVLFTAAAKGADRLIKLIGELESASNNHSLARALATTVAELQPDIVLTGVQAHTDLDGSAGPLLAEFLGMPYVGYISGVEVNDGQVTVRKEYPGGLIAEMNVKLPAVLGIQAAQQPPRYVAVSKVRQAMKTAHIEEQDISTPDASGAPEVSRMAKPEIGAQATMIEGDVDEVAARLVAIFKEVGVL